MSSEIRIGSTCSGYGGLELGVAAALGGRTVWHAEIDRAASRVLAHHWPGVPNHGDITTTDWSRVEPVDILCAGFPCQTVSQAGRRGGLLSAADDAGLWPTRAPWSGVVDAIATLRPQLVIIENVRGLLNAPVLAVGPDSEAVGGGFGRVLGDLADLGFDAEWLCFRAADIGAPHRRERVFLAAADARRGGLQRWTVGGGVRGEEGAGAGEGLQRERRGDAAGDGGAAATDAGGEARQLRPGLRAGGPGGVGRGRPDNRGVEALADADADGYGREALTAGDSAHRELDLERGDDADGCGLERWGAYGEAVARWERLVGRRAPAPTVLGPTGGTRLSPRFVEWMMGLDPGHVTDVPGIDRKAQLRLLGNGVVPQQAEAAVRQLVPRLAVALAA